MKKILLIITTVLALSVFAHAEITSHDLDSAGLGSLNESQKAQIVQDVAKVADANKEKQKQDEAANPPAPAVPATPVVDKVDKWVDLGSKIGKQFGDSAKEAGIAINEFARTPIGLLTTFIIAWHFVGNVILHIISGFAFLTVGICLIRSMVVRKQPLQIEYDDKGKRKSVTREKLVDEWAVFFTICYVLILLVGVWITFSGS